MRAVFQEVWAATPVFCTFTDKPAWHFIPHEEYLPQDLARRPGNGASQPTIPIIRFTEYTESLDVESHANTNPGMQSQGPGSRAASPMTTPTARGYTQERSYDLNLPHNTWRSTPSGSDTNSRAGDSSQLDRRRRATEQAENILRQILLEIQVERVIEEREAAQPESQQEDEELDLEMQATFDHIYSEITGN